MTNKTFIKIFFAALLSIITLYLLLICIINPQQSAPLVLSKKFDEYHDNFLLRKAQLMEKNDYQTLILGSSTSEAFSVQDVNHYLNTTAFHGSLGGGNTVARFVLFKKALQHFPNLKTIIYVTDLYEFNQSKAPQALAYNDYLAKEIEDFELLPSRFDYLKYLFSHQLIESAFTVIKRSKKGYTSPLLNDGSTTTSMIMSTVQTEHNFYSKINPENKPKLREEILENNVTYSQSVLANFKRLDPKVKQLYLTLVQEAKQKKINVIFIMSPYHHDFRKLLFANEDVRLRYNDWIDFIKSLGSLGNNEEGVIVYNPLSSFVSTSPESGVWRDGIHYNSYAATFFLNDLAQRIKK